MLCVFLFNSTQKLSKLLLGDHSKNTKFSKIVIVTSTCKSEKRGFLGGKIKEISCHVKCV